jgi:universal bacterial protein YeaZ
MRDADGMRLLALDTATECCSVALLDGERITSREAELGRGHADRVLPMVDELLAGAELRLDDLDAIAFGRGPGGFTGVRLAASIAQGLAFGAGVPVVPVSDLQAVAQRAMDADASVVRVLVCNDARMQEVYWGCFERGEDGLARAAGPERVGRPETVEPPSHWNGAVHGAGRGFRVYPQLEARVGFAGLYPDLLPRAVEIARLAVPEVLAGRTVAPEHAVPVYLRDEVATPPSRE